MQQLAAVVVSSAAGRSNCIFSRGSPLRIFRLSSLTHLAPLGTAAVNICTTGTGILGPSQPAKQRRNLGVAPLANGATLTRGSLTWRQRSARINSFVYEGVANPIHRVLHTGGKYKRGPLVRSRENVIRFVSTLAGGQPLNGCLSVEQKCCFLDRNRRGSGLRKASGSARVHSPAEGGASESAANSNEDIFTNDDNHSCSASVGRPTESVNCLANSESHCSLSQTVVAGRISNNVSTGTSRYSLTRERLTVSRTELRSRTRGLRVFEQTNSSRRNNQMESSTVCEFFPEVDDGQRLQVTSGSHPIVDTAFEKLLDSLTTVDDPRLNDFAEWLRQVIEYNVPEGKRNRLVAVMLAYQSLESEDMTSDKLEKAALLGWCVELLQAYFLICDDIMDNSLIRRGKTCWYRVEGVKMMAINDAVLCETAIYRILKTFFRHHPNYLDLLELFHEVSFQTSSGQCLDMLSERHGGGYIEERYNAIVLYKTAFYSFSLPIRLGMYLAGISDQLSHKKAEALALRIGHIFQVQDDFLDCYGMPEVIGKVGTDIVDAKCSWLVVKALQIATPEQKKILLNNYGKGEPGGPEEAVIKELYNELDMPQVFHETEERAFADIKDEMAKLQLRSDSTVLNTDVFKLLANKIYRRNK